MDTKATQLDQLLYAWLAETDERKFDQAFQRYYERASPSLIRYLLRCSSLGDLDCEQIAIDALLKFFCVAGRDRRQAATAVTSALPQIQPLNLGPFHERQVQRWTGEIDAFWHLSMTFKVTIESEGDRAWKDEIQSQVSAIPPLQRQGLHLAESVRVACAVAQAANGAPENSEAAAPGGVPATEYVAVQIFVDRLRDPTNLDGVSAESRHPGMLSCVGAVWTVIELLPRLRIPTNGYLFDIAHSVYLDECKARGRKKRGGGGVSSDKPDPGDSTHGLVAFDLDENWPSDDEDTGTTDGSTAGFAPCADVLASDPTSELIDEDFCEQFYRFLSKPLEDAQEEYRQAASTGKSDAQRKRLASISEKNVRLMAVLSMRIEGLTQEAIAESLGLSRNQVKYIAEQAQAAYQQFCAVAARLRR